MKNSKFGRGELVINNAAIYQIVRVSSGANSTTYDLELIACLEDSLGHVVTSVPKNTKANEKELKKFEYSKPRYQLGHRFGDGMQVYLIIFTHNTHEYKYNLSGHNSILANLPEDELHWR